jgi:hypothetical protein
VQGEFHCVVNCKYGFWVAILIIVNIVGMFTGRVCLSLMARIEGGAEGSVSSGGRMIVVVGSPIPNTR